MRSKLRPLANDLSWIVLASAVPAAWVAAALAASCYAPGEASALLLLTGGMALLAGVSVSILLARELRHALADLAAEAERAGRGQPLARLKPAVREFAAIADGLAAAAMRPQPAQTGRAPAGDVNTLLQALAATMRERAREAGIDFGAAIMPDLGPPREPAQIASALAILGESVLTVIPRGGRVLLRANADANHRLTIAFGCHRPAGSDGMATAGDRVELDGRTLAAKRMEETRALVASAGGTLAVERTAQGGEAVTIAFPGPSAARQAA